MIALGNRIEFVTTYLGGAARAGGRRTGQPALARPASWPG